MSNDSDSEVPPEESLIHGRSKRATAGNRLAFLLQHLDDEDVRNDLLAEDETDQQDYEISDAEDVAFGSSDDSDDEGPPKEGQEEDLLGEKELQKQERVEARKKKRKAQEITNINPLRKRVRLGFGNAPPPRPRKKSERISWLPTAEDAPTRQSLRRQTVANKEQTELKLKESQKRSEKAQELLKTAAEKKAANAGPALTQADRLARALKVEKENSRSLNRWEKAEEERQLAQQRRLEALRDRQLEGPVIRYWSGSVIWEGEKIKVKRVHQPKIDIVQENAKDQAKPQPANEAAPASGEPAEKIEQKASDDNPEEATKDLEVSSKEAHDETPKEASKEAPDTAPETATTTVSEAEPEEASIQESVTEPTPKDTGTPMEGVETNAVPSSEKPADASNEQDTPKASTPSKEPASFLDGIHFWASQSPVATVQKDQSSSNTAPAPTEVSEPVVSSAPDAPVRAEQDSVDNGAPLENSESAPTEIPQTVPADVPGAASHQEPAPAPASAVIPPTGPLQTQAPTLQSTTAASHDTPTFQVQPQPLPGQLPPQNSPAPSEPQPPPVPLLKEQAQRTLIMLEAFPELENILPTTKKSASATAATAISSILTPDATPTLSAAESKYLTSKSAKKKEFLPPPPPKPVCAITAKPARFRDPRTRTAYKDLEAYKAIQRVIVGGTAWSVVFDCWTGIVGEGHLGRVAKGVPDCFWNGKKEKGEEKEGKGKEKEVKEVKSEEGQGHGQGQAESQPAATASVQAS